EVDPKLRRDPGLLVRVDALQGGVDMDPLALLVGPPRAGLDGLRAAKDQFGPWLTDAEGSHRTVSNSRRQSCGRGRRCPFAAPGAISRSHPRPRLLLDPPVRMPNHPPALPAGVTGWEGLGPDLVHVVAARRLAVDDLPGSADRLGVVDAFASVADTEHGGSA